MWVHPGPLEQLYTLIRILEGTWEFAQQVHMCFVDTQPCSAGCPVEGATGVWDIVARGYLVSVQMESV